MTFQTNTWKYLWNQNVVTGWSGHPFVPILLDLYRSPRKMSRMSQLIGMEMREVNTKKSSSMTQQSWRRGTKETDINPSRQTLCAPWFIFPSPITAVHYAWRWVMVPIVCIIVVHGFYVRGTYSLISAPHFHSSHSTFNFTAFSFMTFKYQPLIGGRGEAQFIGNISHCKTSWRKARHSVKGRQINNGLRNWDGRSCY